MIFERYESYRDSGVEWLGEIPSAWEIKRIANIFQETKEKGNTTLPFLTVSIHSGVSDKELSDNELDRKVLRNKDPSQNIRVRKNDLVYNMMRAWQGGLGTVKVDGMVSPAYVIASPIETKVQTKYFELLLRIPNGIVELKKYSKGIIDFRLRLYWRDFKRINLLVPTYDTQTKIATYLDQKTQTIDKEITLLEQKTAKYKELKQTLINETVLRGLDRAVKLKESEVEWIGEIPEGWEVKRIGVAFEERSEKVNDVDYPALSVTKNGIVPQLENVAKTIHNDNRRLVLEGDFVINSRSDRRGSSGIAEKDGSISVINIVLAPKAKFYGKYLHHLFRSYSFIEEFFRNGRGIAFDLWTTKYSVMKSIEFAYPSTDEQIQISNYLDEKTQKIDNIIETIQTKIALLKEFRKTLINDVVTGRVKVA